MGQRKKVCQETLLYQLTRYCRCVGKVAIIRQDSPSVNWHSRRSDTGNVVCISHPWSTEIKPDSETADVSSCSVVSNHTDVKVTGVGEIADQLISSYKADISDCVR